MYKNPALSLFIAICAALTLWYAIPAFKQVQNYYTLTHTAPAENLKWFVTEISSEDFRVGADYTYKVLDREYFGETIFTDWKFRNPSSADDELKVKAAKNYVVFYDPQSLVSSSDHNSSLQKKFPVKECVSLGIIFFLLLYFIGLGIYAKKL